MVREYSISDEVKESVEKAMSLAIEVNCFTDKSVFFEFHGHVNQLSVRVGPDKDKDFTDKIFESNFYLEDSDAAYELQEVLNEFQNYLDDEE